MEFPYNILLMISYIYIYISLIACLGISLKNIHETVINSFPLKGSDIDTSVVTGCDKCVSLGGEKLSLSVHIYI